MTKLVVVMGFVIAFGAGLVVGLSVQTRHRAAAAPATQPSGRGRLARELNLTSEQQEQLKKIWSETARRGGREQDDRRRQCRRERDEAIAALVRAEDKPKLDQITQDFQERMSALDKERSDGFQVAQQRTKEILTAEQRVEYEQILARHQGDRERGEHGERGGRDRENRRGEDYRATSRALVQNHKSRATRLN